MPHLCNEIIWKTNNMNLKRYLHIIIITFMVTNTWRISMGSDLSHFTGNESQEFFELFLPYFAQALQCHLYLLIVVKC